METDNTAKRADAFYAKRVVVWVYCPTDAFPLKLADLLVYSYLCGGHKLRRRPSGNQIASNTGLARNTVTAVLGRLEEHGLLADGVPQPRDDWFRPRDTKSKHWADGYQYWRCLIREDDSPLKVADVAVYSFLLSRALSGRGPARWSHAYVAAVLKLDPKTVATSLDRLTDLNLFRIEDGAWCVAEALVGQQTEWFETKAAERAGATTLRTFVPREAPVIEPGRKSARPGSMSRHEEDALPCPRPLSAPGLSELGLPREAEISPFEAFRHMKELKGLDRDDNCSLAWRTIDGAAANAWKRLRFGSGPDWQAGWQQKIAALLEEEIAAAEARKSCVQGEPPEPEWEDDPEPDLAAWFGDHDEPAEDAY